VSTWTLALLVFCLRIVDVSLGTMRTIAVVQGRRKLSVFLGFFEVLIWLTAVSQVILRVQTSPLLIVAFAAGFATGNAVGITLERRLALGAVIVRMISSRTAQPIAARIRQLGLRATTFEGHGACGPETLIYVTCPRDRLHGILASAREIEPEIIYAVEPIREWNSGLPAPLPNATGWRAALQRK
jgi:uncharacterized protein YebE (UPF0316 family)